MLHREELDKIRIDANRDAERTDNPEWTRAYLRLADAADNLNAMIARTEITLPQDNKELPQATGE